MNPKPQYPARFLFLKSPPKTKHVFFYTYFECANCGVTIAKGYKRSRTKCNHCAAAETGTTWCGSP